MKINESTLVAFATSKDIPCDKEGWLWKKGEVNKAFQKRWFVLKGNLLFYFEKHTDKEPIGVIILEGCIIELAEEDQERFGFKISFHGERTRVYRLGTEFQQSLVEWMKLLACASHDYMRLMVFELEQKLIELENIEQARKKSLTTSMTASKSANAISSLQTENTVQASNSSHSIKSMPHPRQNPFNDVDGQQTEGATEVLCPNSIPNNSWLKFHATLGKKIVRDQRKWHQSYKARTAL